MVQPWRTAPGLPSPPRHKASQDSDRRSWSRCGHGRMRMEGLGWGKGHPHDFYHRRSGPFSALDSGPIRTQQASFLFHCLQHPSLSTQPQPLSSVPWCAKHSLSPEGTQAFISWGAARTMIQKGRPPCLPISEMRRRRLKAVRCVQVHATGALSQALS